MSRRAFQGNPTSFFAFQDIVTGVSGIMLFIVLVLALEQRTGPSSSSGETTVAHDAAGVQRRIVEVEAELQRVRARLAFDPAAASRELAETARRANDDARSGEEAARQVAAAKAEGGAARSANARKRAERAATDRAAADEEQRKLEAESAELSAHPRVRYEKGRDARKPILVELGARAIAVRPLDGSAPTQRHDSGTAREVADFVLGACKGCDPEKDYVLFLVRPSAATFAPGVIHQIRQTKFAVGYDPIEESTVVIED